LIEAEEASDGRGTLAERSLRRLPRDEEALAERSRRRLPRARKLSPNGP